MRAAALRRGAAVLTAAAVLAAAGCSSNDAADKDGSDPAPALGEAAWSDVRVPWLDGESVHFGDDTMHQPEQIASIAATADSAIVQTSKSLLIVPSGGASNELARRVAGIPIADPAGHVVAWTEAGAPGAFNLVAYDTSTHERLGSLPVESGVYPFAVDGSTVYLGDGGTLSQTWDPESDTGAVDLPIPDDSLLLDATADYRFFIAADHSTLLSADGDEVEGFDDAYFGSFDPSGAYLMLTDRASVTVWDVAEGESIELPVPGGVVFDAIRWDPDGNLVLRTEPVPADNNIPPDSPVSYLTCDVEQRTCATLPTEVDTVERADGLESSGSGQFLGLLG